MESKRQLFCSNKHYWHLSRKKLKRIDMLFNLIKREHGTQDAEDVLGISDAGRYASNLESKRRL